MIYSTKHGDMIQLLKYFTYFDGNWMTYYIPFFSVFKLIILREIKLFRFILYVIQIQLHKTTMIQNVNCYYNAKLVLSAYISVFSVIHWNPWRHIIAYTLMYKHNVNTCMHLVCQIVPPISH